MQSKVPKLVVVTKGKLREIEMGQELTIGRGYSNLLRLEGDEISRVHAIIYRRNDDFILRDLDSKNGVLLNGSKIAYAQLDPGDRLQVGNYRMVFNPPSNFDYQAFADGVEKRAPATGDELQKVSAARGNEGEVSSSRLFRVRSNPAPNDPVEQDETPPKSSECREEVYILKRPELDQQLRDCSGRVADKIADLEDMFFRELLEEHDVEDRDSLFSDAVLRALTKAIAADRGVVILKEADTGNLVPGAIVADQGDVAVNRVVLRSGFSEGKVMLCPRTDDCGLFRENDTVNRDRIASLISVPLGRDEPFGLLYVDRQGEDADPFEQPHLLLTGRIARLLEMHLAEIRDAAAGDLT